MLNVILVIFSAMSFIGFGVACVGAQTMKVEFDRYQLKEWRLLTGILQLAASAGLLIGLSEPWIGRAAAGGLALMMLTGVGVRIKIKDNLSQMMPAVFYILLNGYLSVAAF